MKNLRTYKNNNQTSAVLHAKQQKCCNYTNSTHREIHVELTFNTFCSLWTLQSLEHKDEYLLNVRRH